MAQPNPGSTLKPPKSATCSLSNIRHHFFQFPRPTYPKSVTSHWPSTSLVSASHMAAEKTTPKELGEMLGYVVKHMVTKDDLAAVEARLDKRIDKLEHRLDRVEAKIDRLDVKLTKFEESEIDKRMQLEVRAAAIEKHLGLNKKIAA